MRLSTKTLTRDGLTYTAHFQESDLDGYRLTGLVIACAGQAIDTFRGIPAHWTVEERDAEFIKQFPALAKLADEVYDLGREVFSEEARRAA